MAPSKEPKWTKNNYFEFEKDPDPPKHEMQYKIWEKGKQSDKKNPKKQD